MIARAASSATRVKSSSLSTRVGIIGLGGAGSILAELLGRLGVGEFILADPDQADLTNLPRLIAADLYALGPRWIPGIPRERFMRRKVDMAERNILRANRHARGIALARDFLDADVAESFKDGDYLFLAADTMGARLLFNALVNQYGVPGAQVGAKVPVSEAGEVETFFASPAGPSGSWLPVVQRAYQFVASAGRSDARGDEEGIRLCG